MVQVLINLENGSVSASNLSGNHAPLTSSRYQLVYHTLIIILAVLIIIHNLLVVYLYKTSITLRKNPSNFLIVNLSLGDLLTGLAVIPVTVCAVSLSGRFDTDYSILFFASNVINDLDTIVIVFSFVAVVLDKYFIVCSRFRYEDIIKSWRLKQRTVELWILSLLISILPVFWSYTAFKKNASNKNSELIDSAYRIYSTIVLIFCFFLPTLIMGVSLLSIIKSVYQIRTSESAKHRAKNYSSYKHKGRKAVLVLSAMFLGQVTCWTPLMTVRMLIYFEANVQIRDYVLELMFALRCTTSLINPVLFVWMKEDFRKALLCSNTFACLRSDRHRLTNM